MNPKASSKDLQDDEISKAEELLNDLKNRLKKKNAVLNQLNDTLNEFELKIDQLLNDLDALERKIPKEYKLRSSEFKDLDGQWENHIVSIPYYFSPVDILVEIAVTI